MNTVSLRTMELQAKALLHITNGHGLIFKGQEYHYKDSDSLVCRLDRVFMDSDSHVKLEKQLIEELRAAFYKWYDRDHSELHNSWLWTKVLSELTFEKEFSSYVTDCFYSGELRYLRSAHARIRKQFPSGTLNDTFHWCAKQLDKAYPEYNLETLGDEVIRSFTELFGKPLFRISDLTYSFPAKKRAMPSYSLVFTPIDYGTFIYRDYGAVDSNDYYGFDSFKLTLDDLHYRLEFIPASPLHSATYGHLDDFKPAQLTCKADVTNWVKRLPELTTDVLFHSCKDYKLRTAIAPLAGKVMRRNKNGSRNLEIYDPITFANTGVDRYKLKPVEEKEFYTASAEHNKK